jgi:YVTN family beta-propeller protein
MDRVYRAGGRPDPPFGEDAMKLRISGLLVIGAAAVAGLLGSGAQALAQNVYITNYYLANVSVVDTATNMVIATIPGFSTPHCRGGDPRRQPRLCRERRLEHSLGDRDGEQHGDRTIPTSGSGAYGLVVTPDGSAVYVALPAFGVDTATNTVTATIPVDAGNVLSALAVTPDGSAVYVALPNGPGNTVSVIATASNTVTATIRVGTGPQGVFIAPQWCP